MPIPSALYAQEAVGVAQRLCEAANVSLPIDHDPSFSNFAVFLKRDFSRRNAHGQAAALNAVSSLLAPSGSLRLWAPPVLSAALGWSFHQLSGAILRAGAPFAPALSEPSPQAPDLSALNGHFWIGILGAESEGADACAQQLLDHGLDLARDQAAFLPYACASQQPHWGLWALEHGASSEALWKGRDALWWLHLSNGADNTLAADADRSLKLTDALLSHGLGSFERALASPQRVSFLEAILSRRLYWAQRAETQKPLLQLALAHAMRRDIDATALVCAKMANAPWLAAAQEMLRAPIEARALAIQAFGDSIAPRSAPHNALAAARRAARL